jgi:hypothetical protein
MSFRGQVVDVLIAEGLLNAVASGLLLVASGALPVKEKALAAKGTVDIGGAIGEFAQNLHSFPLFW